MDPKGSGRPPNVFCSYLIIFRGVNAQVRSAWLQAAAVIAMFLSVAATLFVGH